jgi:hypothetical protein
MRWGEHPTTISRGAFFDSVAPHLVESVVGPKPVWTGARRLSRQYAFHGDDRVLVVVTWPKSPQKTIDEALAWGLALAGDLRVVLLLPEAAARPTLQRVPWVEASVEVFTFDGIDSTTATPAKISAREAVLDDVAGWGPRRAASEQALGAEQAAWVAGLVEWLNEHPYLSARHRPSYLAWHSAGRQVLKILRTRSEIRIEAGVRYSKPTADQPTPPPPLTVHGSLSEVQFAQARSAVEIAIARRHEGQDVGHEEHRLQHALQSAYATNSELIGLTDLRREYPAWRPGRTPAFIDFLGVDAHGRPHVVETKLDHDLMLPVQGLDYWIWAKANPELLHKELGSMIDAPPVIDFIVGAYKTTKVLGPYALRQLETFDDSVDWRFHVVSDWQADLHIESLPPRQTPAPPLAWEPVGSARHGQAH